MKSKLLVRATTSVSLSLALVIGFSGIPKSYAKAQESASDGAATVKTDLSRYKKVMLLPAELDSGEDVEFRGVPVPGAMAVYLTKSVADVLAEKGLLAEKPGPGVAQLRLVVNDLEMTRKGGSATPPPPPFPMVPDLPTDGPGKNCVYTGTASVTAKFTDSKTGETVASFKAKETARTGFLDALPKAIDKVAQAIGDRLEQSFVAKPGKGDTE